MTRSTRRISSQVSDEAPPPYTEASNNVQPSRPAPSTVSPLPTKCALNTTREATADVPPGVHLVQAPYRYRHKNTSIIRDFLVFDGNPIDTFVPDITLRTKNALLHSRVYINDQEWGRPVSVHARTKNSDLILSIHTLQSDQAVRVRASTKNGRGRIFLPPDFKGLLAVSTKNGKCTLSTELNKVAVRVPSRYKKIDEAFGCWDSSDSDIANALSDGVDVWYEINGDGPSTAVVDTKNGNVFAGFSEDDDEISCWPSCSVM